MQNRKAQVTATTKCKRCNGAGFGTWRADFGTCWKCNGAGVVATAWQGDNVTVTGYVARPRAIERGTAVFQQVVFVETTNPNTKAFTLVVTTTKLDGTTHVWTTTDAVKAEAARMRVLQVAGGVRDMTEAQLQAVA